MFSFFLRNSIIFITSKIIQKFDLHILFQRLDLSQNSVCLEIGCRKGYALEIIYNFFNPKILIGIDIDAKAIKEAERWIKKKGLQNRIKVAVASGTNPPFKKQYFDAVFAFSTLHHVENWKRALSEAAKVLKPGGYFIFKEPLSEAFSIPFVKWIDKPAAIFTERKLKEELKKNNFKVLHWQYRGFYRKFLKVSIEGICQKSRLGKSSQRSVLPIIRRR